MKNTTLSLAPEYRGYNIITRESITDITAEFERNDMIVLDNIEVEVHEK